MNMTPEELYEGDHMISLFMGEDANSDAYKLFGPDCYRDWNKLMPVIEEIESMGYHTEIYTNTWNGKGMLIWHEDWVNDIEKSSNSKIEAVRLAVVEFIKWYNQNK